MALGEGSPAIDIVPSSGSGCPAADQRGVARPQRSACDAGAFELDTPAPQQPGGNQPGGANAGGANPGDGAGGGTLLDTRKAVVKLVVRATQRLRKVLRNGYVVDFTTDEPGSALAQLYALGKDAQSVAKKPKRKLVASGRATLKKAGKNKVVAKFTSRARKAFAKRSKLTLLLVLTVKDQTGNATVVSRQIKLKR
jgi:hypothetical protein